MPVEYSKAEQTDIRLLTNVLQTYHPCLAFAEVRVGAIFAKWISDGEGQPKPAVTHNGYPAFAVISITPIKWRALGNPDSVITIDQAAWDSLDSLQRSALIDHELYHLQVKAEESGRLEASKNPDTNQWVIHGQPASDCLGRPRLLMRRHDWQLGGFTEVTQRWGTVALEYQAIKHHQLESGQLVWDWAIEEHTQGRKRSLELVKNGGEA